MAIRVEPGAALEFGTMADASVTVTRDSTLLTFWPPGPDERENS